MAINLISFNTTIRNTRNFLDSKYEELYNKNLGFSFFDYFDKVCYDLLHKNSKFIREFKKLVGDELDLCDKINYRIGISDEQDFYKKVRDLLCKYAENEYFKMQNTGIYVKECYEKYKDLFLDEDLIKFLNSRYTYDYNQFNCFLVMVYTYHIIHGEDIKPSIIHSFDIMDICYGIKFTNVFDNSKTLSYNEFCEFFILRSNIYFKNKLFSEIDFSKLPEIYNSRKNRLSFVENQN